MSKSILGGLRIGSRRSDLARLQAQLVGARLGTNQYVYKEAPGDINLKDPLWKMPEMGVFTSFLRRYLVSGEIDLVVHSWKDLPIEKDAETEIVGTLPRADPRDLLLVSKAALAEAYKTGTLVVLSSSPRRKHNLPNFLTRSIPVGPNGERISRVEFRDVRGNIQTRLLKLCGPELPEDPTTGEKFQPHALIVAKAAIDRFLIAGNIFDEFAKTGELVRDCIAKCHWQVLPLSVNPTAAAQGALAIEMISSPRMGEAREGVKFALNHEDTFEAVEEERTILSSLGGGCHQKIGCTILKREFGKVTFLRGVTDATQSEINVMKIDPLATTGSPTSVRGTVQIGGKNGVQIFDRQDIADSENRVRSILNGDKEIAVLVAKSDALPQQVGVAEIGDRPVWTAGTSTWFALANRGIWVNGTSDSLGESEEIGIDLITGEERVDWLKLTHESSAATDSTSATSRNTTSVGTYRLVPKPSLLNGAIWASVSDKSHFYFSSGSSFEALVNAVPGLVEDFVSGKRVAGCGPGNSLNLIRSYLPADRVVVAYNFADFQRQITGGSGSEY